VPRHKHASIAVLPPPTIVNPLGWPLSPARPLTGISRAPGSMANGGTWVAGIDGSRYLASTTRFRTRIVVVSPVNREVSRCPPVSALYSDMPKNRTRPDASNCSSSTCW
jgi:hypothetical protein